MEGQRIKEIFDNWHSLNTLDLGPILLQIKQSKTIRKIWYYIFINL